MERLDTTLTLADAARERELYRYFDPPQLEATAPSLATRHSLSVAHNDPLTAKPPSSPETTLTALAQLCALRLDASRAMVRSVLGRQRSVGWIADNVIQRNCERYTILHRRIYKDSGPCREPEL